MGEFLNLGMDMVDKSFTKSMRGIALANKNYNKIFCIGANKTGTTTLEAVLKFYGLSMPNQQEQEIRLTDQCFQTHYQSAREFISRYDAFQDLPFSQDLAYVAFDALFPGSKFILTIRDPDEWFDSMQRFHRKIFKIDKEVQISESDILNQFNYLYPKYMYHYKERLLATVDDGKVVVDWQRLYDKDWYIRGYHERNNLILKYFSRAPEKLLVIDVTRELDTGRICEFINVPLDFKIQMPRLNAS